MSMHSRNTTAKDISYNNLIFSDDARCLKVNGKIVHLSWLEYHTLLYLLKHENVAVSRQELLLQVWDMPNSLETRATDDTIKRLRKKLAISNACIDIETIRGFGFIIRTTS